jgi:hypothetical protein
MPGTPMPNYQKLTDAQIWDIVNYVLSLPYQDQESQLATIPQTDEPHTPEAAAVSSVD